MTVIIAPLIALTSSTAAIAHVGKSHHSRTAEATSKSSQIPLQALTGIKENYRKNIEPIFKASCFDCHGSNTDFPSYSNLPGVKQLIGSDIADAKEHLDMSVDFPFKGHGTPKEDLEAIRKSVDDKSMPPIRYWVLHPGSRLNEKERKKVFDWVDSSIKALDETAAK